MNWKRYLVFLGLLYLALVLTAVGTALMIDLPVSNVFDFCLLLLGGVILSGGIAAFAARD